MEDGQKYCNPGFPIGCFVTPDGRVKDACVINVSGGTFFVSIGWFHLWLYFQAFFSWERTDVFVNMLNVQTVGTDRAECC